jgi:hypothetical protein
MTGEHHLQTNIDFIEIKIETLLASREKNTHNDLMTDFHLFDYLESTKRGEYFYCLSQKKSKQQQQEEEQYSSNNDKNNNKEKR